MFFFPIINLKGLFSVGCRFPAFISHLERIEAAVKDTLHAVHTFADVISHHELFRFSVYDVDFNGVRGTVSHTEHTTSALRCFIVQTCAVSFGYRFIFDRIGDRSWFPEQ